MRSIPPQLAAWWRGRRVLVTGATGFIGAHVARALVELGATVVAGSREPARPSALDLLRVRPEICLIGGSLLDAGHVARLVQRAEVVLHLAAQLPVAPAGPLPTWRNNVEATWLLLEACRQSRSVERVIVASSDVVYGPEAQQPSDEESPLAAVGPYGASKVCAEVIARSYAAAYKLRLAITRPGNAYGEADLSWHRLIPGTLRAVLQGERPVLFSDGSPRRDYIHIADVVRGHLLLGPRLDDPAAQGQAFNLGTGRATSALDLVRRLTVLAGRADLTPDVRGRDSRPDHQCLISAKADRLLGWRPLIPLEEGLAGTVAWYAAHRPWAQAIDG